jgi:hypothetical protein
MYPTKPGLLIGFHGCDKSLRDRVITTNTILNHSKNLYDWLGNGIYFWENNQQRALDFAKELKENSRANTPLIKIPSVIGAVIDMGYCLDLLDKEYINLVKESHDTLLESCKTLGLDMPTNKALKDSQDLLLRNLDCAVIENLHLQRAENKLRQFDSVRGVFIEGKPLYDNAGFHEKSHIQICIRNPNCIKGFFIPRLSDSKYPAT